MSHFNDYSIKTKLILIFVVFKILPLLLLSAIGIFSFIEISDLLETSSKKIITKSRMSIQKTTDLSIQDSIQALDKKSQEMLEQKTVDIANRVANFLHHRDVDILSLAKENINQKLLTNFYTEQNREVFVPPPYYYDNKNNKWLKKNGETPIQQKEFAKLKDNAKAFHKITPKKLNKKLIPIYKEISYYDINGNELYKVSSIDNKLKNISDKKNTYNKAENYYEQSLKLKNGEIYVSQVIGAYVGSPVIGAFTKEKAAKANIKFEPEKYGYAGAENPKGKKFEGIVRFVTPVYKNKTIVGYLSFALDHHHIMDFTDFVNPLGAEPMYISNASKGNYAFMWSNDFKSISHPRDYFIVGYNPDTGEMVPGWIDSTLETSFKESGKKDLNAFLKKQPIFLNQSLEKKPNISQIKKGQVALDCRYLNFAPQCQGWSQLTNNGGYGSFIIYWSKVWKLNTAATIPYYTGQYKNSKRGFGFVTIGANVNEFHKAATQTKENISAVLIKEKNNIEKNILQIIQQIFQKIKSQITKLAIITIILLIIIIYIAIYVANNISSRIKSIIIGTNKIKDKDFSYHLKTKEKDEIGELQNSFNDMAESINTLTQDLRHKLHTDDLTNLKNRRAFWKDIKKLAKPVILLLDIDLFKNINDYYGIDAGNFILIEFGALLQSFAKKKEMNVYRMGSDEFILLFDKEKLDTPADILVKEISNLIKKGCFYNEKLNINTTISFTCGVSCGEGNLLEKADLALNEATRKKVSFMTYDDSDPYMNRHKENVIWRKKITYAIANDMVVPYFQEIVDVKNPDNKKYEALIRIIDAGKTISPYYFLDIAKETKLYPELTKIMIEKTFKIFAKSSAKFSINLSVDDITNSETVKFIHKKLKQYDVKERLIFELLESEEISNFDDIMPFIIDMKKLGVKFAIDDFGSGYSNFSYLLKIKPDYIKIDGSLIKNLAPTSNEYHIVHAIVIFAKSLGIKIIAEHVSSQDILKVLGDFDIDYMQGFHFSVPSPTLS